MVNLLNLNNLGTKPERKPSIYKEQQLKFTFFNKIWSVVAETVLFCPRSKQNPEFLRKKQCIWHYDIIEAGSDSLGVKFTKFYPL